MPLPQRADSLPAESERTRPERPDQRPVSVEVPLDPRSGSPVHALQAAIGEAWAGVPAAAAKTLCPGRLALIAALGLAAWVPVAAIGTALLA